MLAIAVLTIIYGIGTALWNIRDTMSALVGMLFALPDAISDLRYRIHEWCERRTTRKTMQTITANKK